jgi:hypothetical protein
MFENFVDWHNGQGRHGRQDARNRGLVWIWQNRTRRWQRVWDVATTVAVLPPKNMPWRP